MCADQKKPSHAYLSPGCKVEQYILFTVPILSLARIFSTRMNGYYAKKRANAK